MIQHGILNSKADYWIHVHPLDALGPMVYWYRTDLCRSYIKRRNIPLTLAASKDPGRTKTGAGYLIPKSAPFLHRKSFERGLLYDLDCQNKTDREYGIECQELVLYLLEHRIITFPSIHWLASTSQHEQLSSIDAKGVWLKELAIEIKAERVVSDNLFVQSAEGGHRVHYTASGAYRHTELAEFGDDNEEFR